MRNIFEFKMKRENLVLLEGLVMAISLLFIFFISNILLNSLEKINYMIYIAILLFLSLFALRSLIKNERFKKSKPRSEMLIYQGYFKDQEFIPDEIRPILNLAYYPFFRAMNAEEYRELEIDIEFYKRMRTANINLERSLGNK